MKLSQHADCAQGEPVLVLTNLNLLDTAYRELPMNEPDIRLAADLLLTRPLFPYVPGPNARRDERTLTEFLLDIPFDHVPDGHKMKSKMDQVVITLDKIRQEGRVATLNDQDKEALRVTLPRMLERGRLGAENVVDLIADFLNTTSENAGRAWTVAHLTGMSARDKRHRSILETQAGSARGASANIDGLITEAHRQICKAFNLTPLHFGGLGEKDLPGH